jgi:diguanylate cyclase (GGDEF)-like protein/PAS domain S-box-containing protein
VVHSSDRTGSANSARSGQVGRAERSALLADLSQILDVVGHMNGSADLAGTLQAVADGIVLASGFTVAVINYLRADGLMEITTVSGPSEVRDALLGMVMPPSLLVRELDLSQAWGRLRFSPHGTVPRNEFEYIPDLPIPTDPNGWHPEDGLFMPLYSSSAEVIGIVSVDQPSNGLLPDPAQQQILEMLAVQAEIAINNARLNQRLQASEASLRLAFDAAVDGMALVSIDPRRPLEIVHSNAALAKMAGELDRAPLQTLSDLLDADDSDHDAGIWLSRLLLSTPERIHKRVSRRGEERWLRISASALALHSTESPQAMVQIEDVTASRLAEQEALEAAVRDPLTGLGNRTDLLRELTRLGQRCRESRTAGVVLFCDLNGFKQINDRFGHQAGDAALVECAARLASLVRGTDRAFRVGGDEFVLLLADIAPWGVDAIVQRIKSAVTAPIGYDGESLQLGISVGSAHVDGQTEDVARILAAADAAMYADKRAHAGHC